MSGLGGLQGARLSGDVADVELVPVTAGEKVQARSPADDLGAGRERRTVREHDPVFTVQTGAVGVERGDGEPVMAGAVPPNSAIREPATARALAPVMSLCQPVTAPSRIRTTGKSE